MKDPPSNFANSDKYKSMIAQQNIDRSQNRQYDEKCWFECLLKEPLLNNSEINDQGSADKPYDPNIILK